jgi:hypothetical protein
MGNGDTRTESEGAQAEREARRALGRLPSASRMTGGARCACWSAEKRVGTSAPPRPSAEEEG